MPKARKPTSKRKPIVVTSSGREGKIYRCANGRFKVYLNNGGLIYQNTTVTEKAAREDLARVFADLDAEDAKAEPIKIRIPVAGGRSMTIQCTEGQFKRTVSRLISKGLPIPGAEVPALEREPIDLDDTVVFDE